MIILSSVIRRLPSHRLSALAAATALFGSLLATLAPPAISAELGRLFFTPQQRVDLDRRRATNAQITIVTPDDLVTVNGHVSRASGKTTTWINGAPQADVYRASRSGEIMIRQGEGEQSAPLKVGETLDRVKGETRDRLGGGTVSVERAPK